MSDSFREKLQRGELTLGVYELTPCPELVELAGYVGYDFVVIDRMFTSVDWSRAAEMVRAAHAFDTTAIIRVQSDPWRSGANPGLSSEIARALSVGADGVMVSVASAEDARLALSAARDWHRQVYLTQYAPRAFRKFQDKLGAETIVMPLIESEGALASLEAIAALPGLGVISLGMGDLSRAVGAPQKVEDPRVWEVVDRAARLAAKHGVVLSANTGSMFRTAGEIEARVRRLYQRGVRCIITQHTTQLLQYFCEDLLAHLQDMRAREARQVRAKR